MDSDRKLHSESDFCCKWCHCHSCYCHRKAPDSWKRVSVCVSAPLLYQRLWRLEPHLPRSMFQVVTWMGSEQSWSAVLQKHRSNEAIVFADSCEWKRRKFFCFITSQHSELKLWTWRTADSLWFSWKPKCCWNACCQRPPLLFFLSLRVTGNPLVFRKGPRDYLRLGREALVGYKMSVLLCNSHPPHFFS